jgi:hypothetical protein
MVSHRDADFVTPGQPVSERSDGWSNRWASAPGWCAVVLLVMSGAIAPVGAQERQDGGDGPVAPMAFQSAPAREAPPMGLDDAHQVPAVAAPAGSAPDVRDVAAVVPNVATPDVSLVDRLRAIDGARRSSTRIQVEMAGFDGRSAADAVEAFWNSGDSESAIEELEDLEEAGVVAGIGIDWGPGRRPAKEWSENERLGGSRSDAKEIHLDFDVMSGNVVSVIRWGSTTSSALWTVNLRNDLLDPTSEWVETYEFASSVGLRSVSAAVVDGYIYVAYVVGNAPNEARLRRLDAATGAVDSGFGHEVVVNAASIEVEEVVLAANADDTDNRIYYAALFDDDSVQWLYDVASDGTTFIDGGFPAVSNAGYSLDLAFISNRTCQHFLALAYSGSDGAIHVWTHGEAEWEEFVVDSGLGSYRTTSIDAYGSTILCAYEYPFLDGTGVRYAVSYTCGDSWGLGDLAVPVAGYYDGYFEPAVSLRGGHGAAIAYQGESGEFDPAFYRFRYGYQSGEWTFPATFNQHDLYTGSEMEVLILPPLSLGLWSVAGVYMSLDPDYRTPYFDLTVDFALADDTVFADGFEFGGVETWSTVNP